MIRQVFVDTNVLINLVHIERLDLLDKLAPFHFIAPDAVLQEVKKPRQFSAVERAIENSWLSSTSVSGIQELTTFGNLLENMGAGEAACLTLASIRGGFLASSDRKRKFLREAKALIGQDRIVRLVDLLVRAIRIGLLTVREADEYKQTLAENSFHIKISSFSDLL